MTPRLEVSRLARDLLISGRERLICLALGAATEYRPDLRDASLELCEEIMAAIAPRVSFNTWLWDQGLALDAATQQLCRLAWVDKMIADEEDNPTGDTQ